MMVVDHWMSVDMSGCVFGKWHGVLDALEVVKMGPVQAVQL